MGLRSGPHRTPRFMQDLKKLTTQQRQRFELTVIIQFVLDLKIDRFRPGHADQARTGHHRTPRGRRCFWAVSVVSKSCQGMDVAHEKTRPLASERTGWYV